MTENAPRTGAARDVPPPRPVTPSPATTVPSEDGGVTRAARAVADAVAGLIGTAGGRSDDGARPGGQRSSAVTGLRDVVSAVAGAVGAAFGPARPSGATAEPPAGPPVGDRTSGAPLGDLLAAAAPRLPIRDAERLRRAYPGATEAEIADALVARAARLTSGIGAATGGLSAAFWFAPLLAVPLELGTETVLIAGVEVVLIGELHELYGRPAPGDARARATAYLASWSAQRSADSTDLAGLGALLGAAGLRALRRRFSRTLTGAVPTAAPFVLGASLAGRANRRATEALAERVLADLRPSRPDPDAPGR